MIDTATGQVYATDNSQQASPCSVDYPHIESTFPKSREILDQMLADCTEKDRAKITWENAARVYNIDLN